MLVNIKPDVVDAKSETVAAVDDGSGDLPVRTGRCWPETYQTVPLKNQ